MSSETTVEGLRLYGPGKYQLTVDTVAEDLIGSGMADDELGDVEGLFGHNALLRADFAKHAELFMGADFLPSELDFLRAQTGAIVNTDSQGFVTVAWYENAADLVADWEQLCFEVHAARDAEEE